MREEIIKMAREAGFDWSGQELTWESVICTDAIERFFHMAQAAEREEIAQMFDYPMRLVPFVQNHEGGCMICGFTPQLAADAIRARGQA